MKYRGADVIVEMLARAGVRYIAGHPGHSLMELAESGRVAMSRVWPPAIYIRGVVEEV